MMAIHPPRVCKGAPRAAQPRSARAAAGRHRSTVRASDGGAAHHTPTGAPPPTPSSPSSNVVAASAPQPPAEACFDWANAWYPLAPVSYLRATKPSAHTVLGHSLAVWRNPSTGKWVAFSDRCPHRLAPLSEGRVDAARATLQCAYHGWQFDAAGACAGIPQADSPAQEQEARASRRSCVARYPTCVEWGLLWVWLDASERGAVLSAARRPALPAELASRSGEGALVGDWFMRELPISYEFLMENLLDPSHVHFSHHGIIGSREKARPLELRPLAPADGGDGFSFQILGNELPGAGVSSSSHFVPPSLAWIQFGSGHSGAGTEAHASLVFYAVPVAPGRSRIVAGYSTNALPPAVLAALQSSALRPLLHAFQWAADLGQHEVLDGDTLLLRYQEEQARQQSGAGPRGKYLYYMPAGADAAVRAFRAWLGGAGGQGPAYGPAAAAQGQAAVQALSRRDILDRYTQHTAICPHCRRAYATVRALRAMLSAASSSGAVAATVLVVLQAAMPQLRAAAGTRSLASAALLFAVAALGCGAADQVLRQLEQRFTFTDYVHADK